MLKRLAATFCKRRTTRIIVLGLDNSGKTSLIQHMKLQKVCTRETFEATPTVGFQTEELRASLPITPAYRLLYVNNRYTISTSHVLICPGTHAIDHFGKNIMLLVTPSYSWSTRLTGEIEFYGHRLLQ